MSGGLIVGVVMLAFGVGGTYAAIALIRNLHGLGDRLLKHYAGYPGRGGWRRAPAGDSSYRSCEGTTLLAFHYVPKTMRQVKLVGSSTLPAGLFVTALGLLFIVGRSRAPSNDRLSPACGVVGPIAVDRQPRFGVTPQPWLCSTWPSLGADTSRRAPQSRWRTAP